MRPIEASLKALQDLIESLAKSPETYADYQEGVMDVLKAIKTAAHDTSLVADEVKAVAQAVAGLHIDPTAKKLMLPTSELRRLEAGMIELRMRWYRQWLNLAEMRQAVDELRPATPDPKAAADVIALIER